MKIIYGIENIGEYRKAVVALGVFDGVHLGHMKVLRQAAAKAASIEGTSIVLTFDPHPQKQDSLYSLKHRLKLIGSLGVDVCVVIRFDKRFAGITAEDFIKKIIVARIRPSYIYIGRNFCFGKGARGDYRLLRKLAGLYGYKLKVFNIMRSSSRPISSTTIRKLISNGRLVDAGRLLSRPVSILGKVKKGDARGRRLGFPTANIDPQHEIIPPEGIYAVKVFLGKIIKGGVCYIGRRPTFKKNTQKSIEVHIFGFNRNIYQKEIEIQFIRKIREDKKFDSPQELIEQIKIDIKSAKKIISLHR